MNEFNPGPILIPPVYLAQSPYERFFDESYYSSMREFKTTAEFAVQRVTHNFQSSLREIAYAPPEAVEWRMGDFYNALNIVKEVPALSPHMQRFCRLLVEGDGCSDIRHAAAVFLNPSPQRRLQLASNNKSQDCNP